MKKAISSILCVVLTLVLLAPISILSEIKASAAGRNTIIHVWLSDSKMGDCPQYAINGNMYYLCFELYDSNTGTKYNNYRHGDYKTTMTFYKPNGSVAHSYTYDNSDNNWIGHKVDTTGTYKGVVSVSGCINGSCSITFSCKNANLVIDTWSSNTKMGTETNYFDKGDSSYYCYKMYDQNTGVLLDKLLPSRNYTVTQSFCDSSGKTLYSTTYENDSNWYGLTGLQARTTYILKIDVKGDFNASTSRKIYTKYYTDGETYSFSNSRTDFLGSSKATGEYYIDNNEFNVLKNKINSHYWYSASLSIYYTASMMAKRNSDWGGSCFGMAATTILDKRNQIGINENFGTNSYGSVSSVNAIARPYSNKKARSVINYYQLSQYLGFTQSETTYKHSNSNWSIGLKNLVNAVKNNNLVLFGFGWYSASDGQNHGHAIVLQSTYVDSNGDIVLLAYDPNKPGGTTVVRINSSYTSCSVGDYTTYPTYIEYTTNYSNFDRIDIDGSNNSYRMSYSVANDSNESTNVATLKFDLTGDTTIYNETGEVLHYGMDHNYNGTMKVISENLIVNGPDLPTTVVLEVENSKSFSFESSGKTLNVSVVSENIFASAESENSESVVIAEDDGLFVFGSDFDCKTYITYNDSGDMIKYIGSSIDKDLILKPTGKGVTVYGSSDKCEVTRFIGDEEKSYTVQPKCKSFTIECNTSSGYTNFAGSNDDKNYNIEVENQETVPIKKIAVDKKEISVVLGQKSSINCTVSPDNATDKSVAWVSADENVATIDASGVITSVGVGETIISAMSLDGSIVDECVLTVTAPPVNSIDVEKAEINMEVGETTVVGIIINPIEATNKNVSWKSKNASIASVSPDGTITANSLGSTVVEVKTEDGGYKAEIKVNIVPTEVSGVVIEDSEILIKKDESVQLVANVLPTNATNKSVIWESSNVNVATVDSQGRVNACGFGTAIITVKTDNGGYSATCKIIVEKPLKSVNIDDITLNYKESFTITPSIDLETGTKYSVEYKSSDSSIATVDSNGIVYGAKKWGKSTATITCTVTDEYGNRVSDTCNVNVGFAWWQWIIGIVLFGFIWY